MKILEIGEIPPPYSGTSVRFGYLCKYLKNKGVSLQVLNIGKSRFKHKSKSSILGPLDYVIKCFKYTFQGYHPHMHEAFESRKGIVVTFIPAFLSLITFRKFVFTWFGGKKQNFFINKPNFIEKLIIWFILKKSSAIICNSNEVKEKIIKLSGKPEKIYPIQSWSKQYMEVKEDNLKDFDYFFKKHKPENDMI